MLQQQDNELSNNSTNVRTMFNNILAISLRSVLMVEETGVLGEYPHILRIINKHYHIKLYRVLHAIGSNRSHNLSDKTLIT